MPRAYFNAKKVTKKPAAKKKKATKRQGYKDREDESLGARSRGKKSQSFKARRDEAQGARKKKSSKKEGRSPVYGLKRKSRKK